MIFYLLMWFLTGKRQTSKKERTQVSKKELVKEFYQCEDLNLCIKLCEIGYPVIVSLKDIPKVNI